MKDNFFNIAGVKTEDEFYKKYPTEDSFFAAHPELESMRCGGQPTQAEFFNYGAPTPELPYMFQEGGESFPQAIPYIYKGHSSGTLPMVFQSGGQPNTMKQPSNKTMAFLERMNMQKKVFSKPAFSYAQTGQEIQEYDSFGRPMNVVRTQTRASENPIYPTPSGQPTIEQSPFPQDNLVDIQPNPQFDTYWNPEVIKTEQEPFIEFNSDYNWEGTPAPTYKDAGFADPIMMGLEVDNPTAPILSETVPDSNKKKVSEPKTSATRIDKFARRQMLKGFATDVLNNRDFNNMQDLNRYRGVEDIYKSHQTNKGTSSILTDENLPYKNGYARRDRYSVMQNGGIFAKDDIVEWDEDTINQFLQAGGEIEFLD